MFNAHLIEKLKKYPSPFYYYDLGLLKQTLKALKEAVTPYPFIIHYALKANADERMLKIISSYGFGADCVSGNEVQRAIECDFPNDQIVFAGVGKTDREIVLGLENDIHCFNCESLQELEIINGLARDKGKIASIALRINPNLDAETHHYITTGLEENKFGINLWKLDDALSSLAQLKYLKLFGLHFHIGSQITDLNVFKNLCLKINEIQLGLKKQGIRPAHLNVGGGLGVDYHQPDKNPIPNFITYFNIFHRFLKTAPGQTVHFELGRALAAQCGALISQVLYIKSGIKTQFAVIDAGMTELIRPALYQGFHKIENLTGSGTQQKYTVVGPICESTDCFGKNVPLPETKRGDLLAIRTAGAYAQVMASRYNLRNLAANVYSDQL